MGHLSGRPGCQAEVEVVLVAAEHEASFVISIILEGSDDSGPFLSRAHEDPALERQIARWKRGQLPGIVGDDDGVVVVPRILVDEVIQIAREREEVEEVIKAQLIEEQCSPGKYYPFNDQTWKLFEEKTGKKRGP